MSDQIFGLGGVVFGLVFIALAYGIIPFFKYDQSDEKIQAIAKNLFKVMGFSTLGLGTLYLI